MPGSDEAMRIPLLLRLSGEFIDAEILCTLLELALSRSSSASGSESVEAALIIVSSSPSS